MRHLPATLTLTLGLLLPGMAPAQGYEPPPADDPAAETLSDGIGEFLRNLMGETEPQRDEIGRSLGEMLGTVGPALRDMAEQMDDVRHYHAPERLENGDILIRRRADAPPPPPMGQALRDMLGSDPGQTPGTGPETAPDTAPRDEVPKDPPEPFIPKRDPDSEIAL